jgi:hypothetical protein
LNGLVVGFARLASFFLLLSQKKETKEKATPYRLFPVVLTSIGGKRKLLLSAVKQPLAEISY